MDNVTFKKSITGLHVFQGEEQIGTIVYEGAGIQHIVIDHRQDDERHLTTNFRAARDYFKK